MSVRATAARRRIVRAAEQGAKGHTPTKGPLVSGLDRFLCEGFCCPFGLYSVPQRFSTRPANSTVEAAVQRCMKGQSKCILESPA